ncbi:twin-arginine translocase TatA/TatE family subunit (plasmid) [Paracoccus sp. TK19116]|uniref:Sec-independent protein translocase protein TatA n=1 Tax=Paracoccus albicereus TaxID=2922394 RepID=A0ABT1MLA8_9RHOB|nr:twin-arginine translocase TatA/TatE family subunit [Paracoccus albicereus]MCQ0968874.1 twin-arginine translocase TatA/TatE family subunit [Paracoccus albicereus]
MLNNIGLPGLLLIAVVVLVLFGRGKVSSLMGEVGKGISSFKKGVKDGSEEFERASDEGAATRQVQGQVPGQTVNPVPGQDARDVTPHTTDRS